MCCDLVVGLTVALGPGDVDHVGNEAGLGSVGTDEALVLRLTPPSPRGDAAVSQGVGSREEESPSP